MTARTLYEVPAAPGTSSIDTLSTNPVVLQWNTPMLTRKNTRSKSLPEVIKTITIL